MSSKRQQAKWWQLYLALPMFLGLCYREVLAPFTETEHILAELGILFVIYGTARAWLRANRSALMQSDSSEAGWGVRLYEPAPPYAVDDLNDNRRESPGQPVPASSGRVILGDALARDFPENAGSVFAYRGVVLRKE